MKVVISSGHGKYVRGASGYIDEVDEARLVVDRVADLISEMGHSCTVFHDNVSTSQNANLNAIVNFHNSKTRDLDVSVHFNAYETTSKAMGTEVLYVSSGGLEAATPVVNAIAGVGFINRGPKKRTDLAFLNGTEEPAILIEVCFVDSKADTDLYDDSFEELCTAIAGSIVGEEVQPGPGPGPEPEPEPPPEGFQQTIEMIAINSEIAKYEWPDRGFAPAGYIKGFALAWATVVQAFLVGRSTALEQAKGVSGDGDVDALARYNEEFRHLGMCNDFAGLDTLRHLYALLYGLGMRESSGKHCCGRDQSAGETANPSIETEAGLFQTSYNANTCSPQFNKIMDAYDNNQYPWYEVVFREEVRCSAADWENHGSGTGKDYQELAKMCPPFAMESTAITLRNRCLHYGPIKRGEAEIRPEADWMLLDVQRYVTK